MKLPASLVPSLMIAAMALVAVLPWGISSGSRFVLPLLPIILIYEWALRGAERLPPWVPFTAGLSIDVLTAGPLGYWSLVYLIGYILAVEIGSRFMSNAANHWPGFMVVLALTVAAAWGIASLYFLELAETGGYIWAALLTLIAYPVGAGIVALLNPAPVRRTNERLERGV